VAAAVAAVLLMLLLPGRDLSHHVKGCYLSVLQTQLLLVAQQHLHLCCMPASFQ
jgi:hypothetical protein